MVNLASYTVIALLLIGAGYYGYVTLVPGGISSDPTTVAQGEALFAQNCAVCHGPGAVGQIPSSPMGGTTAEGAYIAPALNGTAHAWHHAPDALFSVIKDGSPAQGSTMVGWAGRLDDEEIRSVIAYMQSLWPQHIRDRYQSAFAGR